MQNLVQIVLKFIDSLLICRQPDAVNQEFLARMNASAKIHLTPAKVKGKYVIRFVANQENCNEEQIENAWKTIQEFASDILIELTPQKKRPTRPALRKLDRTHSQRFSFTRNVSQELYERQSSMYVATRNDFFTSTLIMISFSSTDKNLWTEQRRLSWSTPMTSLRVYSVQHRKTKKPLKSLPVQLRALMWNHNRHEITRMDQFKSVFIHRPNKFESNYLLLNLINIKFSLTLPCSTLSAALSCW